jgi:hypothetical protein
MKYKILILITILAIASCGPSYEEVQSKRVNIQRLGEREISIYTYDSCEYIGNLNNHSNDVLAHKGNCKFCAERTLKH